MPAVQAVETTRILHRPLTIPVILLSQKSYPPQAATSRVKTRPSAFPAVLSAVHQKWASKRKRAEIF